MTPEEVQEVVEAATFAPSVHNSQPWAFRVRTPGTLEVLADRRRWLPAIDPDGRDLHLSCGAAVEHARLAVRSMGRACTVELLPDPGEPDLLARLVVGGTETATEADLVLVSGIPLRYTDRGPFADRPVPDWLVEEMRRSASVDGAWVAVVDEERALGLASLLARADDVQRESPAYQEELAYWSRTGDRPAEGIPRQAVPDVPTDARASGLRLRDLDVDGRVTAHYVPPDQPPAPEHPLVLVVVTDGDRRVDWLTAGRAFAQVALRAAVDGVSVSPLSQVTEVSWTRAMLPGVLGLTGHPQLVLRAGFGRGRPTTGRRPVRDVLVR